ncbi:gephyrin-like molybdotransferase receptor GlpR [Streptomyces sp. WMMB 322]|uniref:divisome protein SepX/GlpR n=1 Tax=Streptomyces sp. WMMB 322 TaxID=1286821 RepID=UPI0006E46B6E|nr:gephyrin-like molybdotransferase receptor GlpR [Streptomyces sp. WMMB 322]SCK09448.1 hypothetical protein H180DRAFT_00465 [Streptomyces sp. WMMB 322]
MGAAQPLYRVRVNSSGLIYAVIVGAWAAYLVPMWLRRQDELNESRPTERFSTAIRLLSGKAAMERRYAKENERRDGEVDGEHGDLPAPDNGTPGNAHGVDDAADVDESVDVRAYADPKTMVGEGGTGVPTEAFAASGSPDGANSGSRNENTGSTPERDGAERGKTERDKVERDKARQKNKRAKVLARRRRTTMVLFLAFTAGTIVAAVGGLAFLWAPGVPGLLLSAYIVHLRVQERRRFAAVMDKRRAEAAGQDGRAQQPGDDAGAPTAAHTQAHPRPSGQAPAAEPGATAHAEEPAAVGRRALVEQTDHAEWVDQQRDSGREPTEGWEPVPVPLPTYVSAPVAPRSTRGVDLEAPGTWSSARSSAAGEPSAGASGSGQEQDEEHGSGSRRGRGRRQTPLFDQCEEEDRPRAANE